MFQTKMGNEAHAQEIDKATRQRETTTMGVVEWRKGQIYQDQEEEENNTNEVFYYESNNDEERLDLDGAGA